MQRIVRRVHKMRFAETVRKEESRMIKTTMTVEGMMCGMCEVHVCDAIRRAVPSAKKVTASRRKKTASFVTQDAVDTAAVMEAVNQTGYSCKDIMSETC